MVCCLLLVVLTFLQVLLSVESTINPQISEPQDQAQDPYQDSIAACIDDISLDQQLVKTMVISQQKQITQLQDQLLHNAAARPTSQVGKHKIVQCSWVDLNDDRDSGQIKTCVFHKSTRESTLRVTWNGNLRCLKTSTAACCRWFFTMNGQECQQPASIDAQIYERNTNDNNLRPAYLDGLCRNITAGDVSITFNVGICRGSYPVDAYTGWYSTSRIIVEELEAEDPELIQ